MLEEIEDLEEEEDDMPKKKSSKKMKAPTQVNYSNSSSEESILRV